MTLLTTVAIVCLLLGYGLGRLLEKLGRDYQKKGKVRLLFLHPDSRTLSDGYFKVKDGAAITPKGPVLLEADSKMGWDRGAWIVHPELGWNYRAPTRKETTDSKLEMAVLVPSNPASYHRAIKRRRWDETLKAGEEGDKYSWVFPVALIGLVAFLAIMGVIAWIMWRVSAGGLPTGV